MPTSDKRKEKLAEEIMIRADPASKNDFAPTNQCTDCAHYRCSEKMIKRESEHRCFHPNVLHFGSGSDCLHERSPSGRC